MLLTACASASANRPAARPSLAASGSAQPSPSVQPTDTVAPLVDPQLDLRSGPVPVPLELQIPRLRVSAAVLGVGINPSNVMDTPTGRATDAVWQTAFWYRGGGTPGEPSTATIAGHVDDVLGRPAIFAHLSDLRPGDPIVVRDKRTGLDLAYVVTETAVYTLRQTLDPAILTKIYGPGPVSGQGALESVDGLAHLTLITCTGHWLNGSGTYDHRLAVYAVMTPIAFQAFERRASLR